MTNLTGKPSYYTNKSDRSEVRQILQENHLIIQKNLTDLRYDKSYKKTILLYKKTWLILGTTNFFAEIRFCLFVYIFVINSKQ